MKKKPRKKIIILAILLIILTGLGVLLAVLMNDQVTLKAIDYRAKGSLTYKVCLKENEFISHECFTKDRSFIASLIDKVYITLNHEASTDIPVGYDYNYVVEAKVIATELSDDSKVVYEESEVLKEFSESRKNVNTLNTSETIEIDYQKYNEKINKFKKSYVLALNAKLVITARFKIEGTVEEITDHTYQNNTVTLAIPLGEQTVFIDSSEASFNNNQILRKTYQKYKTSFMSMLFTASYLLVILLLFILVFYIFGEIRKQDPNKRKIKSIKRNYERIIVEASNLPSLKDLKIMKIETFDDMLDIRESLNQPIICYDDKNKKICVFIILTSTNSYFYTIEYQGE